MTKDELVTRGQRNVSDALFIRGAILPAALASRRWNIVVYEAFRVCELLMKGLICLAGYTPKSDHELAKLLDRLPEMLSKRSPKLPFLVGVADVHQNGYGVYCDGDTLDLCKIVYGVTTVMASCRSGYIDPAQSLLLSVQVEDARVTVSLGGRRILQVTDHALPGPFRTERVFAIPADAARMSAITTAVERLRGEREAAFYSEREYSESEALHARDSMQEFVDAMGLFVHF